MRLAYYPGCVSRSTGREMDLSTRAVCQALGIELRELDDWNCCGATHVSNELVGVGLGARNLSRADLPVMTPCAICYSNLRTAAMRMEEPLIRSKVEGVLDARYRKVEVRHALDVILEALEREDDMVRVPLAGLKVAPYYGCLLTRPGGVYSPEFPTTIERLVGLLEAEPLEFRLKTHCCGGPIFMSRSGAAEEIALRILTEAKRRGAEVMVTVCPLCHLMMDIKQKALESRCGEKIGVPVLYVTQLVGIALGLGPEEIGLNMNAVSPMLLLEGIYQRLAERGI